MHKPLSLILTWLMAVTSLAQKSLKRPTAPPPVVNEYAAIDKAALLITDSVTKTSAQLASYLSTHFTTDKEKVRAGFVWIAATIQYDYQNRYFLNPYEASEERIIKPLTTHKGICDNYARLFQDVLSRCGIPAYTVSGFTIDNHSIAEQSHAWCVARVNGIWAMYDPTWASSTAKAIIANGSGQISYFQLSPAVFIQSHMPFDHLWQFLHYPVNRRSFVAGKPTPDSGSSLFQFEDSLQLYEQQNDRDRWQSAIRRIEENGPLNERVTEALNWLKQSIQTDLLTTNINLCNLATWENNRAVAFLNEVIEFRNRRAKPLKTDVEIRALMDSAKINIQLARQHLSLVQPPDERVQQVKNETDRQLDSNTQLVNQTDAWLTKYLSKGKLMRPFVF